MSEVPRGSRRSPLVGVAALVVAAAALLHLVLPVLWPLAVVAALALGFAAVVSGRGRWAGVAGLALVAGLLVALVASGFGFTFNPREQSMLASAAAVPPPDGFEAADGPMGVGYCGWFAITCDQAEVIWSYSPAADAASTADGFCGSFLEWAEERGVAAVFVVSASEWRGWYDQFADDLYGKGGERTHPIGSDDATAACRDVVANPPGPETPFAEQRYVVGTTSGKGGGDILVARIAGSLSLPDASPDPSRGPFMILGSLHKR